MTSDDALPRALELLWRQPEPRRRPGLRREQIVTVAIELADADGIAALSMARLADRLGCGTMSLYRHVANKDELVTFMVSAAVGQPPSPPVGAGWREALAWWADGLWAIYHDHPWVLQTASAGPPADPGQVAWLDAGLATLGGTALSERDKLAVVLAVLVFVRGSAALDIEAARVAGPDYGAVLRQVLDRDQFPALAAVVAAGVFDDPDTDREADFRSGIRQLLDGVAARLG